LVPDATPPRVRRVSPLAGDRVVRQLTAYFSEPLTPETVNVATFLLREVGPDDVFGTADDVAVTASAYRFDASNLTAIFELTEALPDGHYEATLTQSITDLSGLPLAESYRWEFRVGDANFWRGGSDGVWNDASNWTDGVVPGTNSSVVIDLAPGLKPRWQNTTIAVRNLLSVQEIEFVNCDVTIRGQFHALRGLRLSGGRLANAEVLMGNGSVLTVGQNALLEGLTVQGTVAVGSFDSVRVKGGLTLAGTLRLPSARLTSVDTQTINGGTIEFLGGSTAAIGVSGGTTLTLGPGTLVRGGNAVVDGTGTLVNRGTIRADVSGQTIFVQPGATQWLGAGEAVDGGVLSVAGNWGGGGTLTAVSGRLDLGGTFTPTSAVIREQSQGTVRVIGVLNLSSGPLVLDAQTGSWTVAGGTLVGGTVELRDGVALEVGGNALLEGLTVQGTVAVGSFDSVRVKGGLTLAGTLRLPSARLTSVDTQTINGGTIEFLGGSTAAIGVSGGTTLTLGPGTLVRGGNAVVDGTGTLVNRGTIRADVSGQTIFVQTGAFVNEGTLEEVNGGNLVAPGFP
jgi:fibronectin-binding autotransporter adhesin